MDGTTDTGHCVLEVSYQKHKELSDLLSSCTQTYSSGQRYMKYLLVTTMIEVGSGHSTTLYAFGKYFQVPRVEIEAA